MARTYFQISGQSLGRLAALSDGIFAVAMTLLILNVHVPTAALSQVEQPLWAGDAMRLEATRYAGLLAEGATDDVVRASERRIMVYQALYASAALLCVVNTYLSIACLIVLQLNSVIGPRIGLLNRF